MWILRTLSESSEPYQTKFYLTIKPPYLFSTGQISELCFENEHNECFIWGQIWRAINISFMHLWSRTLKALKTSQAIAHTRWVFTEIDPELWNSSEYRSSHHEMFLGKDVLTICSKFTGEHPCLTAILILIKLVISMKSHFGIGVLL